MRDNKKLLEELTIHRTSWFSLTKKRQRITEQTYTADEQAWDKLVVGLNARPHYMQSSAWSETKTRSTWPVSRLVVRARKGALLPIQVFSRTVPGLGRLHYAPQVSGITPELIPAMTNQVRDQYGKGMVFKIEPYQVYSKELIAVFKKNGWKVGNSVQYRNSVIVDLRGSEEDVFARFKKRARWEVRVAQRNNVRIEKVEVTQDKLNLLGTLMDTTAKRSGAFIRSKTYTNKYWQSFARNNQGALYFAWHDSDLLAGAYIIKYGDNAWYKDGGSVRHKSKFMGSRLLQWEIMRDLQTQGVEQYDLSGIPALEDLNTSSMKGLYVFKTAFANETTRFMPALELPFGKRYPLWPKVELQFLRLYSGFRKDFWY